MFGWAMARRAHPNLVLATCILASSLAFVDGSVTNVGLPAIGKSLHAGGADLQWVINAYLLPLSALLLLGGAAGDRYGRKRLLVAGTAMFAVASIACALSSNLTLLLIGRGLAGHRRGGADAQQPGDPGRQFFRRGAGPRHRHLGLHRRGDGGHRSGAGRLADRHGGMAARSS